MDHSMRLLAFGVLIVILAGAGFSPCAALSTAQEKYSATDSYAQPANLIVTGTTHNATTIRILAEQLCVPVIRYSDPEEYSAHGGYGHEVDGFITCTTHAVILSALEPETRYLYRVEGCGGITTGSFSTLPEAGTCSFIVYGDTREQAPLYSQTERHRIVADRIAEESGIFFVINSGDLVSESENLGEWLRFFDSTALLRSLTTYIAVPGNHDRNRTLLSDQFGMPGPYSFDCGEARILILDSTDDAEENLTDQARRVISTFGRYRGAKIVVLHHPAYSSDEKHFGGWENLQRALVPAFRQAGVDLVFSGHVHAYEEVNRDGITYITEARGGAPAYPLSPKRIEGSVAAFENTLGYSRVTVDPDKRTIVSQIIKTADTSPDLKMITKLYPPETVEGIVRIRYTHTKYGLPDISNLNVNQDLLVL